MNVANVTNISNKIYNVYKTRGGGRVDGAGPAVMEMATDHARSVMEGLKEIGG